MLKPVILALSVMLMTPVMAQAADITLLPSVKLQIGDSDNRGHRWDGGRWRDHDWWQSHYQWRDHRWQPHGHREGRGPDRHHDRDHRHDRGWHRH
ncbi:DUF2502 domain-containing protein [Siccibacter colletis]|jgi:hypothetical protein|uniref:DUF2502 domain-containing protein n=1 Tax=Siccibacter colletis TaxID=1505757 RepID=UPI003CE6FE57